MLSEVQCYQCPFRKVDSECDVYECFCTLHNKYMDAYDTCEEVYSTDAFIVDRLLKEC